MYFFTAHFFNHYQRALAKPCGTPEVLTQLRVTPAPPTAPMWAAGDKNCLTHCLGTIVFPRGPEGLWRAVPRRVPTAAIRRCCKQPAGERPLLMFSYQEVNETWQQHGQSWLWAGFGLAVSVLSSESSGHCTGPPLLCREAPLMPLSGQWSHTCAALAGALSVPNRGGR